MVAPSQPPVPAEQRAGQLIDAGNSDFSGEAVHVESVKSPSVRVSWAVHGGHLYRDGEIVNVYWAYWLV